AAFSLSQADRAAVQAMASMALWCILIDACSLQLLCYVRCIQSPLNLLEGGFASRMEICNQLLQGIDGQGRSSGLVDRTERQEGKSCPPSPRLFSRSRVKI